MLVQSKDRQSNRTRSRRRLGIFASAVTLGSVGVLLSPVPAYAENDSLSVPWCYSWNGYQRACVTYGRMAWGSGVRWTANGSIRDQRSDGLSVRLDVKLDRTWPVSDTGWIMVVSAINNANSDTETGLDPTNGAWFRICAGTHCSATRYVTDNS